MADEALNELGSFQSQPYELGNASAEDYPSLAPPLPAEGGARLAGRPRWQPEQRGPVRQRLPSLEGQVATVHKKAAPQGSALAPGASASSGSGRCNGGVRGHQDQGGQEGQEEAGGLRGSQRRRPSGWRSRRRPRQRPSRRRRGEPGQSGGHGKVKANFNSKENEEGSAHCSACSVGEEGPRAQPGLQGQRYPQEQPARGRWWLGHAACGKGQATSSSSSQWSTAGAPGPAQPRA